MPTSFLHYEVVEKLGEGGMGIVYLALDTKLKRKVALKFLPARITLMPAERARFQQEAQAAAVLNHPHIAQVYAIEECKGELFIVMEYVEGKELKTVIDEDVLTDAKKAEIAGQIAQGIKAAHDKGIIHRDIKTRNILLNHEDSVKIMDFGLAHVQGTDHLTKVGTTLGTTAYMAPEQLAGQKADIRSDIWSYGVVLYELFTDKLPFNGLYEQALMYAIIEEEPVSPSEINATVPDYIEDVIYQCLEKDSEQRFQNFDEVIKVLSTKEGAEKSAKSLPKRMFVTKSAYFYVGGPVMILILGITFFISFNFSWFGPSVPVKKYLAVLPIENIGENPDLQAICAGLAETFSYKLSELGTNEDSYWVAPASEMRKEKINSISQARKIFGVNLAISSSIQNLGDSTRLFLELVDADNIHRLGSEQVTVSSKNLASLEQDGVKAMLKMLHISLNDDLDKTLKKGQPSSPKAYEYYLKGLANLQNYGNVDSLKNAVDLFHQAIEKDEDFALAHAGLGEAYWHQFKSTGNADFADKAEKSLERAITLNTNLAPVQVLMGTVKAGTGESLEAIAHFKKAIEIDPKYSFAYREMAKVYDDQGEAAKAKSIYEQAIKLKPEYWEGYKDLGIHYLNEGNFDSAIKQFRKVLTLTPQNSIAYSNLGATYYYTGNYNKAREMFEKSLMLDKNPITANNLAGLYYSEGKYSEAANMYEIALKNYSNRYEIWGNLATAYDFSGQSQKARQAYQTAIEKAHIQLNINPNDSQVLADLGAYYSDVDDTLNSLQFLKRAIAVNPENLRVRQRAVSTYEQLGMRDEALKWIDSSMILDIEVQPELKKLIEDPRYKVFKKEYSSSAHR